MDEAIIYTILGEAGFTKMVSAFYKRVKVDDLIGPMYPEEDLVGAEERLRDFLLFRFGCLLYTSPSPRDQRGSRMPSSA